MLAQTTAAGSLGNPLLSQEKPQSALVQAVFDVMSCGLLDVSREPSREMSREVKSLLCQGKRSSATSRSRRSAAGCVRARVFSDIAAEYGVNRKTTRRRLDAAELVDAERARRSAAKRAEEKRMKRLLGPDYRNPERAPEHLPRFASTAGSAAIRLRRPMSSRT